MLGLLCLLLIVVEGPRQIHFEAHGVLRRPIEDFEEVVVRLDLPAEHVLSVGPHFHGHIHGLSVSEPGGFNRPQTEVILARTVKRFAFALRGDVINDGPHIQGCLAFAKSGIGIYHECDCGMPTDLKGGGLPGVPQVYSQINLPVFEHNEAFGDGNIRPGLGLSDPTCFGQAFVGRSLSNLVGLLCRFHGIARVNERSPNQEDSNRTDEHFNGSGKHRTKGPSRHVPLGLQVLLSSLLFGLGIWTIFSGFHRAGNALEAVLNGGRRNWLIVGGGLSLALMGGLLGAGVFAYWIAQS